MKESSRKTVVLVEQDDGVFESLPVTPRQEVIQMLSIERGRSPDYPLNATLISRWCADLGFEKWLGAYSADQIAQLRAVNQHYASGGTRKKLLEIMRGNPKWYLSKT